MTPDRTEVLDRAAFDDFAGLFSADELHDVIEEWHADSRRALEAIAAALARDDRAQVGEIAHRAAGGGLALGATSFAAACERLRAHAEGGDPVSDADVAAVRDAVAATYLAMTDAGGI